MKPIRFLLFLCCAALVLGSTASERPAHAQQAADVVQVAIDGRETRQQIDGFGAAFPWQAPFLKDFPEPGRSAILDALFSQQRGAGFSIVRNMINCSTDRRYPEFMTIAPAEGVWEFDHDTGQVWLMQQAKARGTSRFFSTVWSPPPWMKTNGNCINVISGSPSARTRPPVPVRSIRPNLTNDVDTRGRLDPEKRQDFADYLSRYVREYKSRFGLDMYAISIANEPEVSTWYDSSLWSAEEMRDFIRDYLLPTFARDGVQTRVIIPETGHWEQIPDYVEPILSDQEAAPGVQIIAGHDYGSEAVALDSTLVGNRRLWQTEVSNLGTDDDSIADTLRWARSIHDYMAVAESNAWLWWWGALGFESGGNYAGGEGLVYFKAADRSYRVAKRLYGISNYSRFIRPGFVRLDTPSSPAPNVYVTAYKDPATQRFVAVALNTGASSQTVGFAVNHLPIQAVTPFVTSASSNMAQQPSLPVANGVFTATLSANSITTFVTAEPPDLYVLGAGATSRETAIQIVNGATGLQNVRESLPTNLPSLSDLAGWSFATGDANGDGSVDLYAIGSQNTTSGRPELHILDGASGYRSYLLHTTLDVQTTGRWSFAVADANGDAVPDLYMVGTGQTMSGQAELRLLDGADSFRSVIRSQRLALQQGIGTAWHIEVADANADGSPDLYAIGTTPDGSTTVQTFDGTAGYQTSLAEVPILLPLQPNTVSPSFVLGDANNDGVPDLYVITGGTVRVLNGINGFQSDLAVPAITLPTTGSGPQAFVLGRWSPPSEKEASASTLAREPTLWHVAPSGLDVEGCGTVANPCQRIATAVRNALPNDTILLDGGIYIENLLITKTLTLANAQSAPTVIDGNGTDSVIRVMSPTTALTITGVTIRNGRAPYGGGIDNLSGGNLRLVGTTVLSNTGRSAAGGGLFNYGTMTLVNSTITDNSAVTGGGIVSSFGTTTITNSTITRNAATGSGERRGGGVFAGNAGVVAQNTILANNNNSDCAGSLTSQGYTIVGSDAGCVVQRTMGDQIGTAARPIDPQLGPLGNYGGPTATFPLRAGSPAIDAGNPAAPGSNDRACPTADQRGISRPRIVNAIGAPRCDIGAFEYDAPLVLPWLYLPGVTH